MNRRQDFIQVPVSSGDAVHQPDKAFFYPNGLNFSLAIGDALKQRPVIVLMDSATKNLGINDPVTTNTIEAGRPIVTIISEYGDNGTSEDVMNWESFLYMQYLEEV